MDQEVINRLSDALDRDFVVFSGPIRDESADRFIALVESRTARRKRVTLLLSTHGGDADAAFRIGRCLQNRYGQYTVLVAGFCKSAGTLIATGADELYMGPFAELGPLDVQMLSDDGIMAPRNSGLAPVQAFLSLDAHTSRAFDKICLTLTKEWKVAPSIALGAATSMVTGLYRGIYEQIDPLTLGEQQRSQNIGVEYGERLASKGGNVKKDGLYKLVAGYPSHNFVVDRLEAQDLFTKVYELDSDQQTLVDSLLPVLRNPSQQPFVWYLNDEVPDVTSRPATEQRPGNGASPAGGGGASAKTGDAGGGDNSAVS